MAFFGAGEEPGARGRMWRSIYFKGFLLFIADLIGAPPALAAGEANPLVQDIGVSLAMAGLLCVVFARLRIPYIAAFLISGVFVGPEFAKLVTNKANIETIASLGLVILLFVIGLEINFKKLLGHGKSLVLTGVLQFPLCIAFGYAAGVWLQGTGWAPVQGKYVPLYAGFTAAASSTLLVVKLLYEKMQADTVAGRLCLGVLIFQDIWAIVVLAVQPNVDRPELGPVGLTFLGIGLVTGIAFLLAKYVLPHFFRWIAMAPDLLLVAALGWCFGVGALGNHLGSLFGLAGFHLPIKVSYEMSALIAGAVIAGFPYSHDVVTRVAFVRDFLVTLFFVALGMGIPRPDGIDVIMLAGALSAIALLARLFVFFPLMYFSGLDRRSSFVSSVRLAQISEFCLVIAYLGLGYGHIEREMGSAIIFAFVITALITPMLFQAADTLHDRMGGFLSLIGFKTPPAAHGTMDEKSEYGLALLGFHRMASSFLYEIERANPELLKEILVIDFNVALHRELRRRGATVRYGDLANAESLHHLGLERAKVIVSTIPDDLLKGTSNLRLARQLRHINPEAVIIVNALGLADVARMYEAGAHYVFLNRMDSAVNLVGALHAALNGEIREYREDQEKHFGAPADRAEVFP